MSYVTLRKAFVAWALADLVIGPILVGACLLGWFFSAFLSIIAVDAYGFPWMAAFLIVLFAWYWLARGTARLIWWVVQTAEPYW